MLLRSREIKRDEREKNEIFSVFCKPFGTLCFLFLVFIFLMFLLFYLAFFEIKLFGFLFVFIFSLCDYDWDPELFQLQERHDEEQNALERHEFTP